MRERAIAGGAISVEIRARFDGSVLSVHHLVVGPRGLTWPTRLLFAAGALGLAVALGLLGAAGHGTGGQGCSVAFAAAVLLVASCLPLAWLRLSDERQPRDFTVGPGRGADLPLAEHLVPEPRFALVRMTDDGFELRGPQGSSRPLELDDRASVILGATVVQITTGLPPRRYRLAPPTRWLARLMEGSVGVWVAAWLCILIPVGAALLGALYTHHAPKHRLDLDPAAALRARITIGPDHTPVDQPPPVAPARARSTPATPQARTTQTAPAAHASRAAAAEVQRALATIPQDATATATSADHGDAQSTASATAQAQPASAAARAASAAQDPTGSEATAPSREEAERLAHAQAVRSPLLGLYRDSMATSDALAGGNGARGGASDAAGGTSGAPADGPSGTAQGGPSAASESAGAADPMGSLTGDEIGEAYGVGGLGLVGTGAGGGGSGDTIGLGDLGTIGHGAGTGTGEGYGRSDCGLTGRSAQAPAITPGTPNVRGALDKEIIRRVVRAHVNQVRFCYEQQLQDDATLEGRVLIEFTIAESGAVLAAVTEASSLSRDEVGACIAAAVRRWTFPSVKKHVVTEVHYPFALHAIDPQK